MRKVIGCIILAGKNLDNNNKFNTKAHISLPSLQLSSWRNDYIRGENITLRHSNIPSLLFSTNIIISLHWCYIPWEKFQPKNTYVLLIGDLSLICNKRLPASLVEYKLSILFVCLCFGLHMNKMRRHFHCAIVIHNNAFI